MVNTDFIAWTVAFFVCYVLDVFVWELLVTAFQFMTIKNLKEKKKAVGEKLASPALKNVYL